jgi:hypothetical protein
VALYDRLMGLGGDDPAQSKLSVHTFTATLGEFARGVISGAQAQAIIDADTGAPLDPAGIAEAQALLATVTGSATNKLMRAKRIEDALLLAERRVPGYDTVAAVKAKLGV